VIFSADSLETVTIEFKDINICLNWE